MRLPAFFRLRPAFTVIVALALAFGGVGTRPVAAADQAFLIGADVSALGTIEAHGGRFYVGAREVDALNAMRSHGFDCFRLRLFVSPNHQGIVTNDLAYTLALARRVKATGAALLLDLHYSDTWADPQKQHKPAAWEKLPFDELVAEVGCYTREVLEAFRDQGTPPEYLQIGNEITNGLLWPDGRVEFEKTDDEASWDRVGRLLRAGTDAVRATFPAGQRPKVMLHIESTGNVPRSLWFFQRIEAQGVPYDLIGLSFYPEWHGTLADLRRTLKALAETFHKPLVVAETAYPYRADSHWEGVPHLDFPLTPAGQLAFLQAVLKAVRATPEGLGAGVIYWHPESIPTQGLRAWLGGSCALFDPAGKALPALGFATAPADPSAPSPLSKP